VKAAIYRRTGSARDVLEVVDLPLPQPQAGEVRVRLATAGVNPTDVKSRSGFRGRALAFDHQVPGHDGAGVIDAVGDGVDPSRVGQRVWVYHAALGRPAGTAAEAVTVPAEQAVPLPPHIDFAQAAGIGIPFMTAHRCLFADGDLDGESVLVAGGGGAVGNAAIQLAKSAGARVAATVSTDAKAELAHAAGAHLVVRRDADDAVAQIRSLAPSGVRRVVEVALGPNVALDLAVAARNAAIAVFGTEPSPAELPIHELVAKSVTLRFVLVYLTPPHAIARALSAIGDALEAGALMPLPTREFVLDDIVAAHEAVERGAVGKVVVRIDASPSSA
jgi:NADPH:quinone reductase